ncbi:MAG TPA: bifunctional transaldolase/phosoglucose isomerase, partial [Dehalococcoidia bacterium]|nr:bifunctional transaldolase/phosoglucose isomerase [Dehalococcoidia bacterium]
KSFGDSFAQLASGIEEKLEALSKGSQHRQSLLLFDQQAGVDAAVEGLRQQNFVHRAWDHDPTAWTPSETAAKSIRSRLGWLDVTEQMIEQLPSITEFADQARGDGFKHAVVLGMGGSSLCPEVLRQAFGVREGYPDLRVLDSTDPRAIRDIANGADPGTTLYVVSSKSGTTTEPNDFFAYFWEKVKALKGESAGENFASITDPGTPLQKLAEERGFRKCFLNPPDIGGRYSALSYFGVVPAAIMGIDVAGLLDRAQRMEQSCVPVVPVEENAGALLGAAMGALAQAGRNKVTFICSPGIGSMGLWLEQLLAESTGKEGTGLIPIAGEPLGSPDVYGDDRLFVYLRLAQHADPEQDRRIEALEDAKQPQVRISLNDLLDLGQEFFRWEMATATAGSVLSINPFDEPNVQESKDNTVRLLSDYEVHHRLPQPQPTLSSNGVSLVSEGGSGIAPIGGDGLPAALREFLGGVHAGDYVGLMAYIDPNEANAETLERVRTQIRDRLHVATTAGFGPRFLHSTGQLHKGGPNSGVFLQITGIDGSDQEVPGRSYTFQTLIDAQALGDLQALEQHQRRVIRLDLGRDIAAGLPVLEAAVREALG